MRFQKGQSGNPNGRPKGALNRKTQFQKTLMQFDGEHVGKLLTSLYKAGVEGDIAASKVFLEYVLPKADKQIELGFDNQDKSSDLSHLSNMQLDALVKIAEGAKPEEICPCCHPENYPLSMNQAEQAKYGLSRAV